jgi:putative flavoprotein involved in K+ transport
MRKTDTIIIGAGQAALSLSFYLTQVRHDHVLLERGRVGEAWLNRWDSLSLLTPNWMNRLHGGKSHADEDGFLKGSDFATYLRRYSRSFGSPAYEHSTVERVAPKGDGFMVETDAGTWFAESVVVATGYAAEPRIPAVSAPAQRGLVQMHSSAYRNPESVRRGAVLVVGAGPSGQQIAAELRRAGRRVMIAVGSHARSMRRYRGRDIWRWLRETGDLGRTIDEMGGPRNVRRGPSVTLSGARGGEQLDLAVLDGLGVTVAGRFVGFDGSSVTLAGDLDSTTAEADLRMRSVLDRIDAHISVAKPDWPHGADRLDDVRLGPGPAALDLDREGISTVIWATGYHRTYRWLDVPALGGDGEIVQRNGISRVPGLYTLGLNFQRYRGSHMIGGVGADAALLAGEIVASHAAHREAAKRLRRAPLRRLAQFGLA